MCDISDNKTINKNNNNNNNNNNIISSSVVDKELNNNNNNNNINNNNNEISTKTMCFEDEISPSVARAFQELSLRIGLGDISEQPLDAKSISGIGENSYGSVLRITLQSQQQQQQQQQPQQQGLLLKQTDPHYSIAKISPKNDARRAHMRVVDCYAREVFMYERVFSAYHQLAAKNATAAVQFDIVPAMYDSSLLDKDEFIIFEDLSQYGYHQNERAQMPTYDLVACALVALAKLHSMSFVLQAQNPKQFAELVAQLQEDILFTEDIEPVTVEFGKRSLSRTRIMLQEDAKKLEDPTFQSDVIELLQRAENSLKTHSLRCVNGAAVAPYAVICHGDFWNNNILYKYDATNAKATEAKLIDFQMSRYAPPVLDLVHYLYACTEKELRDKHYDDFLIIYYDTLMQQMSIYGLEGAELYPQEIYRQQLRDFGVYGLIMSAFALPFFISHASEFIDIDEVSEAIKELSSSDNSDADDTDADIIEQNPNSGRNSRNTDMEKCIELIEEFDMLNARTLPIFKRRMTNIALDMIKYDMAQKLFEL